MTVGGQLGDSAKARCPQPDHRLWKTLSRIVYTHNVARHPAGWQLTKEAILYNVPCCPSLGPTLVICAKAGVTENSNAVIMNISACVFISFIAYDSYKITILHFASLHINENNSFTICFVIVTSLFDRNPIYPYLRGYPVYSKSVFFRLQDRLFFHFSYPCLWGFQ